MDRRNTGNTAREPDPRSEPVASNGGPMAFAGPHRPGGHFTNRSQFTPTGIDSNMASQIDNSGAVTPVSQYGPAIGSQQIGPNCATAAAYSMQPFVQLHPNAQNHPIIQVHPVFHNVGVMVSTNTPTPGGIPDNTAFNARHQRQVVETPYSIPMTNETLQSANAFIMAQQLQQPMQPQPPQPAQAAAPQMSMDETVDLVKDRMKEKQINFQDDIKGLEDLPRFAEAEKRAILKLTPELAKDFPADKAGQRVLALGFYNSLVSWLTRTKPGVSKAAIKRIKSKSLFSFKITAWKLLVFKSHCLARVKIS